MDTFVLWMLNTPTGTVTARVVLVMLGAGILINQILLAAYVHRKAVPVALMVMIVVGAAAGAGTLHAGVVGDLGAGAVSAAAACACLIGLLLTQVGTPTKLSRQYQEPVDFQLTRTRTWLHDIAERLHDLKDAIGSDFGALDEPKPTIKKERQP